MRVNTTRQRSLAGEVAVGTMCNLASSLAAETLGHCGYDFVVVEMQHGESNLGNVQVLLHAVGSTPATPMVRVPGNDPIHIQRVLDLGAYGIIVPFINNREQAQAIVTNAYYPPLGERSWGPARGTIYGGEDYFSGAADELLLLPMLESKDGMDNAREILEVEGIGGCFVGPTDLNISLGYAPGKPSPRTEDGIAKILEITRSLGKIPGIHAATIDEAKRRADQGFRFITVMADTRLIRMGAQQTLAVVRG